MPRNWRGSSSIRGTRGRHFHAPKPSAALPAPEKTQSRLTKLSLGSITVEDAAENVKIEDVDVVGTFNWISSLNRVELVVPGRPPRWQDPVVTRDLNEDGGIYYRDVNSAHYPTFPQEPAIRAVLKLQPELDLSKIDIFGCGNTIGSLLSFVKGEDRTFRFGIDLIRATLFLVRKTNTPGETIDDVRGYGHSFPEAYTAWEKDVQGSTSHQRVIRYKFAGLNCCVRSESDGYLPDLINTEPVSVQEDPSPAKPKADISELLALNLGLTKPLANTGTLEIESSGALIPQHAVFDLKTRNIRVKEKDGVSVDEFLHRLWVNQTPNFIMAFHTYGKFQTKDIHILDAREKLVAWEKQNAAVLEKLGALLHKLISFTKESDRGRCEVRRVGEGPLEIWSEVPGWSALPDDLRKRFGEDVPDASTHTESSLAGTTGDESGDEEDYFKF